MIQVSFTPKRFLLIWRNKISNGAFGLYFPNFSLLRIYNVFFHQLVCR
jgi:hypothetical protein